MTTTRLTTVPIADYIELYNKSQLKLNPDFQRRKVWTQPARVFLIDTILRELSLPKFYIRTKIDLATRNSIREVVDGQQRLSAILDFANDKFKLTKRAGEFEGYTYSTLPEELQEKFLNYPLAVEQLLNASDNDVLEVFARLNSYGETLNAAEKRHAEFQGQFKWAVRNASKKYAWLWENYSIIGVQQRLRMYDDEIMAELFGILIDGVKDGGGPYINKLYSRFDKELQNQRELESKLDTTLSKLTNDFNAFIEGSLGRRPHFLMLFAAVAHSLYGIGAGDIGSEMPRQKVLKSVDESSPALGRLSDVLSGDSSLALPEDLARFRAAATSSTQRISSRRVRFIAIYDAITG